MNVSVNGGLHLNMTRVSSSEWGWARRAGNRFHRVQALVWVDNEWNGNDLLFSGDWPPLPLLTHGSGRLWEEAEVLMCDGTVTAH